MESNKLSLLEFFRSLYSDQKTRPKIKIGIGLSDNLERNTVIIKLFQNTIRNTQIQSTTGSFEIVFYSNPNGISASHRELISDNQNIELIITDQPEKTILTDLLNKKIDGIIRGSLSATKFLSALKTNVHNNQVYNLFRLALLETAQGKQFLFAPVGIDEAESVEMKVKFIEYCRKFFKRMNMNVKINILGEGRAGDLGRSQILDEKIQSTIKFLEILQSPSKRTSDKQTNQNNAVDEVSPCQIEYKEILIENAIEDCPHMIFAPDGVSGNLIYRTLVHLGNGKSYGAVYLREYIEDGLVIIDTSRVAPGFELLGALDIALGLAALNKN